MSEKIKSLKRSVSRDEEKVRKIQEEIKSKKEKIKELKNAENLNRLNALSAKGYPVDKIITAIGNKDTGALIELVGRKETVEESGTSSAFEIKKEDTENE